MVVEQEAMEKCDFEEENKSVQNFVFGSQCTAWVGATSYFVTRIFR